MPVRKPPLSDEKPQCERFLEAAREAGASEDPGEFERVFGLVVRSKTPPHHPAPSTARDKDTAS